MLKSSKRVRSQIFPATMSPPTALVASLQPVAISQSAELRSSAAKSPSAVGRNWPRGGPKLDIVQLATELVQPRERVLRKHSKKQITKIAASIEQFGFVAPILVDGANVIIAGYARWLAAKELDLAAVPVVRVDHLTSDEVRALVIADNKLAEEAGWEFDLLHDELLELSALELGFSLEVTGLSTAEIDHIVIGSQPTADPADEVVEAPSVPISREGDIFLLGKHKLACGDSRDPAVYAALMGEERARMVFSDAPYNVPIAGNVSGLGKVQHDEFAMASGEMTAPEFTCFLASVFKCLAAVSVDGAIHFQCMDFRHMGEMLAAGGEAYTELKQLIVWSKDNAGMGAFYRSQHELIFVWKVGKDPHTNTFGLGGGGRYRTNVWTYPGVNTMRKGRLDDLAAHPTVKPIALVADAIRDVSKRGEIVLDPFIGSGTTILAAERTGRPCRGIEIEPKFVDVAIGRWEKMTGQTAVHLQSGMSFGDLAAARSTGVEALS